MLEAVLTAVTVIVAGLVAGGYTFLTIGLNPVKRRLPPAESVQVHNGLARNVDRYIPQAVVLMVLAAAVLAVVADGAAVARGLLVVGALCGVAISLVSMGFARPINRQLPRLVPAPDELGAAFDRWERLHLIRFAASLVAFLSFTIVAIQH